MVRAVVAAVVTCAVVLVGSACGAAHRSQDPESPAAPARTSAAPVGAPTIVAGFDYSDPDAVCRGFAAALLTQDATTDTGPADAYRRAGAYMLEPLPATEQTRGDARWAELVAHRARVDVEFGDWAGELPADHPTTAFRAVLATTTPVGADGWRGSTQRHAVYCSLYRSEPDGWRVAEYTIEFLGDSGESLGDSGVA